MGQVRNNFQAIKKEMGENKKENNHLNWEKISQILMKVKKKQRNRFRNFISYNISDFCIAKPNHTKFKDKMTN